MFELYKIYPSKTPNNRLGNEIVPCRGEPHLGPGCYIQPKVFFLERVRNDAPTMTLRV